MHPPHGAPVPDRGDRDQGHRPARPPSGGEDKEPGANGESIPAERRVARGREAYPGHLFAHGDGKRPRPCVRVDHLSGYLSVGTDDNGVRAQVVNTQGPAVSDPCDHAG